MPTASPDRDGPVQAARALALVRRLTATWEALIADLDELDIRAPSRLPGWSRGHLLSHLARNADGLVNLLAWARTGVEHPMYTSDSDRDADIAKGGSRARTVIKEDFHAASGRFFAVAEALPPTAWGAQITNRQAGSMPACKIPWLRTSELAIHLVDMDSGFGFGQATEILEDEVETLVDDVAAYYADRDGVPAVRLHVELPAARRRTWAFGSGDPVVVSGPVSATLAWLTGRSAGAGLHCDVGVPALPAWL